MKSLKTWIAVTLLSLAPLAAHATVTAQEVDSLVEHIEKTMFPVNAVSSYKLTHRREQDGGEQAVLKTFAFVMTMKDDKNLLAMYWPATSKHKYLVKSGENIWMYFSDVRRSIRLSSRDSFMGTDANNYDMMQLNIMKDYTVASYAEDTLDGQPVLKIELNAKENTEGYHKIVSWVSPKERRLLQNDCYSISGALIKSVYYRDPFTVGDYSIPGSVLIKSNVNKGRSTLVEISNVQPKTGGDIKDSMFTLSYLETVE